MNDSRELVAKAVNDLLGLSKSLNVQHFTYLRFLKAVEIEAERVNKSGLLQLHIQITGSLYELGKQCELVLFRIFQESLNNSRKHAQARNFNIRLQFKAESFNLTLADDGQGFAVQDKLNGFNGLA